MIQLSMLLALAGPPLSALTAGWLRLWAGCSPARARREAGYWWVVAGVLQVAATAAGGHWLACAVAAGNVVAGAALWWRNRRRDRARRSFGAKSRARVAALVRKARERARPRPVLRPIPGTRG